MGGPCPNCHSGGIVAPVVTPELRAATTRFYQNLGEDFVPGAGLYRLATGRYYFSGDEGSRLFGAINLLPYAGIAIQKVARGTTSLYRAVGPAELADIQATGALRSIAGLEGKYFTTSAEAASSYAKQAVRAFGDPPYTLIRTDVPNSIFRGLTPVSVDRGIPAWVIPNDRLPGLIPKYLDSMPIPGL